MIPEGARFVILSLWRGFMKSTRRQMIRAATASGLAAMGSAGLGISQQSSSAKKRRVLAILGDAYHCVAPLDQTLVAPLRKDGWEAVVIMDYAVPWDDFPKYDLIILSREGHEYVKFFRDRDTNPDAARNDRPLWITPAQEQKFEEYVKAGGRLFLYHDGFGFYPKGNGISNVAKSYFIRHPASVNIEITPTGKMPELTRGVTPFNVVDEEYYVDMGESQSSVCMESRPPEHGRHAQGWAHSYGKGKVVVLIPGHSAPVSSHPMVRTCVQNILTYLT